MLVLYSTVKLDCPFTIQYFGLFFKKLLKVLRGCDGVHADAVLCVCVCLSENLSNVCLCVSENLSNGVCVCVSQRICLTVCVCVCVSDNLSNVCLCVRLESCVTCGFCVVFHCCFGKFCQGW